MELKCLELDAIQQDTFAGNFFYLNLANRQLQKILLICDASLQRVRMSQKKKRSLLILIEQVMTNLFIYEIMADLRIT